MNRAEFLDTFNELIDNRTEKFSVKGVNSALDCVGAGIYVRCMWDLDDGQVYKYQIIVAISPDKVMVTEWNDIDDKVFTYVRDSEFLGL